MAEFKRGTLTIRTMPCTWGDCETDRCGECNMHDTPPEEQYDVDIIPIRRHRRMAALAFTGVLWGGVFTCAINGWHTPLIYWSVVSVAISATTTWFYTKRWKPDTWYVTVRNRNSWFNRFSRRLYEKREE